MNTELENGGVSTDENPQVESSRTYFLISANFHNDKTSDVKLMNQSKLLRGNAKAFLRPSAPQRGFPAYLENPRFRFGGRQVATPCDLQKFHGYWLVSEKAKIVFETVDPKGFAFCRCETELASGMAGPDYWLCDVLAVLDAVDEKRSKVAIRTESNGHRYYTLLGSYNLLFKPEIIGNRHIFIMAYCPTNAVCDEVLKTACEAAQLTGLLFRKPSN